ncbi:unnamed protein product [Cladocopium goreaui]|uniref:Uncharacterized protein n=1 Tax=Cladocopium goreaui TaxID=2562237 RepID=A0A9P1BS43_9DINO|nr:unnamed protein product [Cladocopium goreaui]
MSLVDSTAVFEARAASIGVPDDVVAAMALKGWVSHGTYAFAVATQPGADEQAFLDGACIKEEVQPVAASRKRGTAAIKVDDSRPSEPVAKRKRLVTGVAKLKVQAANRLYSFARRVIDLCVAMDIPVICENPRRSLMWNTDYFSLQPRGGRAPLLLGDFKFKIDVTSEVVQFRAKQLKKYMSRAAQLSEQEFQFKETLDVDVRRVLEGKRLLLFKEMAADAKVGDETLFQELTEGFRLTGEMPQSKQFPAKLKPAMISVQQLRESSVWAKEMIHSSCRRVGSDPEIAKAVFEETQQQLKGRERKGRGELWFDKLRLTLVMSLYKTLLTGGEPPSSSLRVLRPFLRVRVSKYLED